MILSKIIWNNDSLSNHYENLNLHRFVNDSRITCCAVIKSFAFMSLS